MSTLDKKMKFSVSIAVYKNDQSLFFKRALESVFNQSIMPSEVVLIVDGPVPERTQKIIMDFELKYKNLLVVRLENNVGHGEARRIGLDHCQNELVALMDSDDLSLPDRFEKQLKCFEDNDNLSVVGGQITEFINTPENIVGLRLLPTEDKKIKQYLKSRCPFNQMTVMFKKSDVLLSGGYKDWYQDEDYYLWIRMYLNHSIFKNIEDTLVNVRVSNDLYGRRGGFKYFKSESKLQYFMWQQNIISLPRLIFNVNVRFAIQILLPNNVRAILFQKLFRKSIKNE